MISEDDVDRFMSFVHPEPNSGCWLWEGGARGGPKHKKHRYGGFSLNGKWQIAHRISYEMFVDKIPDGLIIDHLCRTTWCVNPKHLEPVTYQENAQRGDTGINQSSKAYCDSGHAFSKKNTYITPSGARSCRICRKHAQRRYVARKKV